MQIDVVRAKLQLSQLIELALSGEEVVISEDGKPLVRLVPHGRDTQPRDMGVRIWEGEIYVADDFDELPARWLEVFEDWNA
ncbi:type II toxin-antitoxin system Phd/YefM family antitoxin [Deinococcus sp.]|uniref:type II toxin-antitoxin system Phd/YefM family antitoxin n=1 Tax=Deinococcus sp. TaxID=47478 RepID=UPI003B5937E4